MSKVSETIVRALIDLGVTDVFGIPSVHNIGLYDALRDETAIRHILCRHESTATHMADGYARSGKGVGVVIVSTGPGVGYTLAPLIEAFYADSPILVITSNIGLAELDQGTGRLHEFNEQDSAFKNAVKKRFLLRNAGEAVSMVSEAVRTAQSGRPGPVYLEVPVSLWDKPAEGAGIAATDMDAAVPEGIDDAVSFFMNAERPLILAGLEALRAGLGDPLACLAEAVGAPVFTEVMAKGLISADHALSFGTPQFKTVSNAVFGESDAVLAIGSRLRQMDAANYVSDLPGLIHADWDDKWMGKNHDATFRLAGNLPAIMDRFVRAANDRKPAGGCWAEGRKRAGGAKKSELAAEHGEMQYLAAIREAIPRDGTLVADNTLLGYWSEYFYPAYDPLSLVAAKGATPIGFSFPAAVGFKVARPDRPMAALTGDGGFLYGAQELATCARHGLSFPVILINDSSYGVIDYLQNMFYKRGHETDLWNPDFTRFAKAFHADAVTVSSPGELEGALDDALVSDRMCLIEVRDKLKAPFGVV